MASIPNEKIRQILLLALITLLAVFLFYYLQGFIPAFCGALILYILLRKPHFYLTEMKKWKPFLSAIALLTFSFFTILLPFILITFLLGSKVGYVVSHYKEILEVIKSWLERFSEYTQFQLLNSEQIEKLVGSAATFLPSVLSETAGAIGSILMLYFVLYFMLIESRNFEKWVRSHLPFHNKNAQILLTELKTTTYSNSIALVVLAILQSIFALIGYLIFGVDEPFFWAVVTGVFSFIPVVGTTLVWIPLAIFLWIAEAKWQGIGLAIYGVLIVGNVDNLFRFMLQKKFADTHPLITFFGVIVGMKVLGFIGIFFGPLIISYFILLLKIYNSEFNT